MNDLERIFDLQYNDKISAHQGYILRRLVEEGYDVSTALEGRIDGVSRCYEMERMIKAGDDEGIRSLIALTAEEELAEKRELKEFLESQGLHSEI